MSMLIIKDDDFKEEVFVINSYKLEVISDIEIEIILNCSDKKFKISIKKAGPNNGIMKVKSLISDELQKSLNLNTSFVVRPYPEREFIHINNILEPFTGNIKEI